MNNNDLFKLYLIEVNTIEEENKKFSTKHKAKINAILIFIIGLSLGLITLWTVAQEIMMKLRFK